jgi:putative zinc finger/helix-turn-helix YgiT family protein
MNNIESEKKPNYCECCGSDKVSADIVETKFQYNNGQNSIWLNVLLPVFTCAECDFEYTASEAELIKHNAICTHLNLLLPSEVLSIRKQYKLSIKDFSDKTGIGTATISRWESGSKFQSKSQDNYLRLLSNEDNLNLLISNKKNIISNVPIFDFLKVVTPQLEQRAKNFQL